MAGGATSKPEFSVINGRQPLHPRLNLVTIQTFLNNW